MTWRDHVPADRVLADDELVDMMLVRNLLPSLKFDFKRSHDPGKPFSRVTIERVIVHHVVLAGAIEELSAEVKRITIIANGYAAQVGEGPLTCKHCGNIRDFSEHAPLAECARELSGHGCREPERHHEFEPKGAL